MRRISKSSRPMCRTRWSRSPTCIGGRGRSALVVAVNRFDWERAQAPCRNTAGRRAALRFERVLACQCRNVNAGRGRRAQSAGGRIRRNRRPGWHCHLDLLGRGGPAAQVECLEAELADLGPELDHRLLPGPPGGSRPKSRLATGLKAQRIRFRTPFSDRFAVPLSLICGGRNGLLVLFELGVPLCANSLSRRRCCSRAARCLRHAAKAHDWVGCECVHLGAPAACMKGPIECTAAGGVASRPAATRRTR